MNNAAIFSILVVMKNPASKKAHAYFQSNNPDLQSVFAKVKVLDELNRKIAAYLDPHIATYCQVANLVTGRLIIIVANGSIATQVRLQTPDLIKAFKQDSSLRKVQEIHCKVRPSLALSRFQQQAKKKQKMQPLSTETAAIIRNIAESLQDPALKEIMQRIAEHTSKQQV